MRIQLCHWPSLIISVWLSTQGLALSWPTAFPGQTRKLGEHGSLQRLARRDSPGDAPLSLNELETRLAGLRGESLSQRDIDTLFTNIGSFDSSDRKSDCFRHAATSIQVNCATDDPDAQERVNAAISMTLCELATARHHSAPLECAPFMPGSVDPALRTDHLSVCVEALARSAQHWSSYSGYMREIPQLCTVFRRWNEMDMAKAIYRNATLEKVALLQLLTARESRYDVAIGKLEDVIQHLYGFADHLQTLSNDVKLSNNLLHVELSESIQLLFQQVSDHVSEMRRSDVQSQFRLKSQLEDMLAQVTKQHLVSLSTAMPSLEGTLQARLNFIFNTVHKQHQSLASAASVAHKNWEAMGAAFYGLQIRVESLSEVAILASSRLQLHADQSITAHERQDEVFHSAQNLAQVMRDLTNLTRSEIQAINATAARLLHEIHVNTRPSMWQAIFLWTYRALFDNAAHLNGFVVLPVLYFAARILRFACFMLALAWHSAKELFVALLPIYHWFLTKVFLKSKGTHGPMKIRQQRSTKEEKDAITAVSPASYNYPPSACTETQIFGKPSDHQHSHSVFQSSRSTPLPSPSRVSRIPSRLWKRDFSGSVYF